MEGSIRKRGRPSLFPDDYMKDAMRDFGKDKRGIQNMHYFSTAMRILDDNKSLIPNYDFFINDRRHMPRQCVFTELGRLYFMIESIFNEITAKQYVVTMAQEIGKLSSQFKLTTREAEQIIREKRLELKEKYKPE